MNESLLGHCRKVGTHSQCLGQMEKLEERSVLPVSPFACLWVSLCIPGTFSPGSCPAAVGVFGSPCARAGHAPCRNT